MNNLLIESLYLHFPFCRHLCNYCDFYKVINSNDGLKQFHKYLEESWKESENHLQKNGYEWGTLKTFYMGGGTPSLWKEEGANFLKTFFQDHNLSLAKDGEHTLEVNPGSWTEEGLKAFREMGINRFSLGIQALRSDLLKDLDRIHRLEDVYETLEFFHKADVNFSMDFMLGLPFSIEKKRNVISELEEVLKYDPDHFSVYILTPKGKYIHADEIPHEDYIEEEFLKVSEFLISKGYDHYEVSNFGKKNKYSQHNLRYWNSQSVAAFGPSATGLLAEKRLRYKWKVGSPLLDAEWLTEKEFKLEQIYLKLRTNLGLNLEENRLEKLAEKWVDKGVAKIYDGRVILNAKGFLIMDSLMDEIFSENIL